MRWSKHARDRGAERRITLAQATEIVQHPDITFTDKGDNPCYIGQIDERRIKVVVAADDPGFIVTVIDLDD